MWVLQHRLAVVLVAAAALATAGVLTLARPEYRSPSRGGEAVTFKEAVPPAHGWRWDDPTPGFHLGDDGDKWNISLLKPGDIPAGAGVLASARMTQRGRPELIYVRSGCIGVQPTTGARRLFCPPTGPAVVIAYAGPERDGSFPLFVTGAVRSDVTRVTVDARGDTFVDDRSGMPIVRPVPPQVAYDANGPTSWDAFLDTTSPRIPWQATVSVYGKRGKLATLHVRLVHPGEAIYCVSCR